MRTPLFDSPSPAVPSGFEVVEIPRVATSGKGRGPTRVILRARWRDRLMDAGIADPRALARGQLVVGSLEGGRAPHALLRLGDEEWVLKAYRRGGTLALWNVDRYWGARRFLEELDAAAHAERAEVPCAEILALVLVDRGIGSVEAWQLSRYLPGARPLGAFLGHPLDRTIFRRAGGAVRQMHRAGIDHPDLHLGNLLVSTGGDAPRVSIVDWDRARRRAEGTWNPLANLHRLWRSARKRRLAARIELGTGRGGADASPVARACLAFIRGYFEGDARLLGEARRYFETRALLLDLRSAFWRSQR
jgi:3-deoxy-D-manno-octulosonic acid kinase